MLLFLEENCKEFSIITTTIAAVLDQDYTNCPLSHNVMDVWQRILEMLYFNDAVIIQARFIGVVHFVMGFILSYSSFLFGIIR